MDLFQMVQQPLDMEKLISFERIMEDADLGVKVRGVIDLPSNDELQVLFDYLEVNSSDIYLNTVNSIYPFCYVGQETFAYVVLHSMGLQVNKDFHTKKRIEVSESELSKYLMNDEWGSYFGLLDKPARIPAFKHFYEMGIIPDDMLLDTFVDVYTTNEFGLGTFDHEIIMDLYDNYSTDAHKHRVEFFKKEVEKKQDENGWVTIYRGCTDKGTDAYSWTLDRDVARMFAGRSRGKVFEAKILVGDVLDYFIDRGESEVIVIKQNLEGVKVYGG